MVKYAIHVLCYIWGYNPLMVKHVITVLLSVGYNPAMVKYLMFSVLSVGI